MDEPLNIIKDTEISGITLRDFIKRRKLLKTKFKLMQIEQLDKEIKRLNSEGLTFSNLNLDNIWLTKTLQVVCTAKIIPYEKKDLKLTTYLIYLSYLYETDLLSLNKKELKIILSKLKIPPKIEENLFALMEEKEGAYFSDCIELMNNSLYRENKKEDKLTLQRSVK